MRCLSCEVSTDETHCFICGDELTLTASMGTLNTFHWQPEAQVVRTVIGDMRVEDVGDYPF